MQLNQILTATKNHHVSEVKPTYDTQQESNGSLYHYAKHILWEPTREIQEKYYSYQICQFFKTKLHADNELILLMTTVLLLPVDA